MSACKHGHPFTPENTAMRIRDGRTHRVCRACARAAKNAWRERRRDKTAPVTRSIEAVEAFFATR